MKKITLALGLALTLGFVQVNAQNSKRVSAFNYMNYGELDNAQKAIDEASVHPDTKDDAKTWKYRGDIYTKIAETKEDKYKNLSANPLEEVVKSYGKVIELDVKKNYQTEAKQGLMRAAIQMQNKGIGDYNNKDYASALNNFEGSYNINKNYLAKIDTAVLFNAALSAEKSNNLPKAKSLYKDLIAVKYNGAKSYLYLAQVCNLDKDAAGAEQAIKEGRIAYPNDKALIIEELNIYLSTGKTAEAIANLKLAIEKDPKNEILYFNLGTLYDNMSSNKAGKTTDAEIKDYSSKAVENYKKAIEIKENYFDALFNLGAFFFNDAVKMNEVANAITDNKKYNTEMVKVDARFKESMPYFEKAKAVNTDDKASYKALLNSLKALYVRLGENEKYKAITEELKNY